MADGRVVAIFISPSVGMMMERLEEVEAIARVGLKGDRYAQGTGSWNRGRIGKRQVTLINGLFFDGSGFEFSDSRRNIVTRGIELMTLISRDFMVGSVMMCGVKYCDPCDRPSVLTGRRGFRSAFHDCGGLVAEVLTSGVIRVGDQVSLIQKSNPGQE